MTLISDKRIQGYIKYIGNERHPSDGKRGWTDVYYYEVPDDIAPKLIAKGAWREGENPPVTSLPAG